MLTLLLIGMFSSVLNLSVAAASSGGEISQKPSRTDYSSMSHDHPATEWNKTYGGTNTDIGRSVVQTADGGYAITGFTDSYGSGGSDVYLVKTDSSGTMLWNKTYGGTDTDVGYSIAQTTDGGYAIGGSTGSYGSGGYDFYLVKTDSSGTMLWNKTYGGTNNDYGYSVVHTADGGYAIAGYTSSDGVGSEDVWLIKVNSDSNLQWTKAYGGAGGDSASSVVQTHDGGYALTGTTDSYGAGGWDVWLVRTDSVGKMQWNKTYGGTEDENGNCGIQTSDGGYALTGWTHSFGAGGTDFWLIKTDSDGNAQWNRTYGGAAMDIPMSVVQTSDGGYALAGFTYSFGAGGPDMWLVKTDSAGNIQWNNTYGGTNWDVAYSMIHTSDGGYVLTGYTYSFGAGGPDMWLVKTDSAGNMQWNKMYGGASDDEAESVVQTSDGGYALAGITQSYGAGGYDSWLVKTDSAGNIQLNVTYGGADTDYAFSVVQTGDHGYALAGATNSSGAGGLDFWLVRTDSDGNMQWNKTYGGTNDDAACSMVRTLDDGYALAGWTYSFGAGGDSWLIKLSPEPTPSTKYPWPMFHHALEHAGCSESPAPNTNQTLWNYTTGGNVISSPTVADDKVYVGSGDNRTYCLDASTGASIWNYTTGGWVQSSPAVAYGKVYVGSDDSKVYCLDASTGAHIWNYTTGSSVCSSPAVAYGKVYVGSGDGKVYCLDALTGVHIWNYTTEYQVFSSPAVADNKVYVGSIDSRVYCLDALTGAHIWNYTTGNGVLSSPAVADGKVYVGSGDGKVYCLDALTGVHIWNYTTGDVDSSPAVAGDKVYVGSYSGKLYCLDASNGAHIWDCTTGGGVFSSPAVAGGKVYVGSSDNRTYCLDALTGAHIWNFTTGNELQSSPAVADGVVYVGSFDCVVYAFGNVVKAEDYSTIQEAIDAADPETTIWIAPGVYNESLVINKTLTLIGKVGSSPIFSGGGSGTAITLLPGACGSIIAGIVITNWDRGILVANSANCKIYDNIMSSISKNGIVIEGTNAANNVIYSNIFQQNAIAINLTASSAQNTIYKNIVTSNTVGLKLESGGNVIYANSLAQNEIGINVSSSGNVIYHNNFIDNTVQVAVSPSASNTWDDGYPSGGNYWGVQVCADKYRGPGQNLPGSDGVNDTGYAIDQYNIDRYPLLQPFSQHDIGITEVFTSKTVVAEGFTLYIDVRILNYGTADETFAVTVYANTTVIGKQIVTVATRSSMAVTFAWNTAGLDKANYTISAVVDVLPDETDWIDNNLTDGTVKVTIPGDVTGEGSCDMQDVSMMIDRFMATPADVLRWDPNCDVNCDLAIDMADISIAIDHFMQT